MAKSRRQNEPSQRQRRVNELVRHALAEIFQRIELSDPELREATVTVTEVRASSDLREARVFVMPLGGANQDSVVAALQRHRRFLRGALAERVTLKYLPALTFVLDTTFDHSDRVEALLRSDKVAQDLG